MSRTQAAPSPPSHLRSSTSTVRLAVDGHSVRGESSNDCRQAPRLSSLRATHAGGRVARKADGANTVAQITRAGYCIICDRPLGELYFAKLW